MNTRRDANLSGVVALLTACCACTSLADLSSYSDGSGAPPPPAFQSPSAEADDEAVVVDAPAPDAGTPDTPNVEAQNPANVALVPDDGIDTSDDCAGDGAFTDADATACYLVGDAAASWREGRDFCQSWGGALAQVGSREENALLSEHADLDVWLGANDLDQEGTFRWLDGSSLDDAPWGPGQPDNYDNREDCVELRAIDDNWNDAPCTSIKPPLCERALQATTSE